MSRVRAIAIAVAVVCASAGIAGQVPKATETFDAAWTIIKNTHFDKTMNGLNWEAVRDELRPRAAAATTPAELRAVVRDMLGRLGLSHFALIPSGGETTVDASAGSSDTSGDSGIELRLIQRDLVVTHVDADLAAQVHPGWRVIQIGAAKVTDLLKGVPEADNERLQKVEAWRIAQTRLRGPAGSTVNVVFENAQGAPITVSLKRRPESGSPVTVGNLPTMYVRVEREKKSTPSGGSVGVIRFNVWMTAVDPEFQRAMDEFRRADGIIIDLRGNPGGLAAMLMGISGHFVNERVTLGVMKTRDSEFRFVANPRLVTANGDRVQPFEGPLAILVDSMTGSASECFAGGMQAIGRARVFGQTSMGQALPALFDRLPNGDVLIHAYGDFVTTTGVRLEGRGVIPDDPVPLDPADLLAGRDRTMDAALAWMDRPKSKKTPQRP
ncbi:MAG: S41 family peptidase [Vicinamibacterales bacterium]